MPDPREAYDPACALRGVPLVICSHSSEASQAAGAPWAQLGGGLGGSCHGGPPWPVLHSRSGMGLCWETSATCFLSVAPCGACCILLGGRACRLPCGQACCSSVVLEIVGCAHADCTNSAASHWASSRLSSMQLALAAGQAHVPYVSTKLVVTVTHRAGFLCTRTFCEGGEETWRLMERRAATASPKLLCVALPSWRRCERGCRQLRPNPGPLASWHCGLPPGLQWRPGP